MAEWFRHDTDARNDIKLKKLARDVGLAGIGAFWVVAEILFEHGGVCPAQEIRDELEFFDGKNILEALSALNLVEIKDGTVSSHRVSEEIFFQEDSRRKKSEAGIKGNDVRWAEHRKAIAEQSQCDRSAIANHRTSSQTIAPNQTLPIKKDISPTNVGSISKENRTAIFRRPSVEEVRDYCSERNNNVDPNTFVDFYESKGWKVGNTPMKDWRAAVRTWERSGSNAPAAQRKKMVTDRSERARAVNPDGTLNLLG